MVEGENLPTAALRKARIQANAFEVVIAFVCFLSTLSFFVDPTYLERSAFAEAAPAFRYLWALMLLIASSGILYGVWKGKANIEVAGLISLSSASAMQSFALISVRGWGSVLSIGVFFAIGWACLVRARLLWKYGIERVTE